MGGEECFVKLTKLQLKFLQEGLHKLTHMEWETLFKRISSILNERPLIKIPEPWGTLCANLLLFVQNDNTPNQTGPQETSLQVKFVADGNQKIVDLKNLGKKIHSWILWCVNWCNNNFIITPIFYIYQLIYLNHFVFFSYVFLMRKIENKRNLLIIFTSLPRQNLLYGVYWMEPWNCFLSTQTQGGSINIIIFCFTVIGRL